MVSLIIISFNITDMNHHLKMFSYYNLVRQFSLNLKKNQKKNHYDCLGVTPKATQGDIKNAYYKLSKEYHPDTNTGNATAADKFRDIAEAYEILGNVKARKLYDRGISLRGGFIDDSQSNEPVKENFKHEPFYRQRNKPLSTRSAIAGKSRYYDMDEWTKAHYSETLNASQAKKEDGRMFVKDKTHTDLENKYFAQVIGVICLLISCGLMYGTDASRNFDQVNLDRPRPISKEQSE